MDGEEDELALILLQALDVALTRFDRLVATTLIDGDADGAGECGGETRGLKINFGTFNTQSY